MRKFLLLGTIFVATGALAFGGIFGGGSSHKSSGVSSIGVHIDANGGNETPNITLANCDAYAGTGLVDNETYNGGYAGLASDNQTQCRCPAGTKWNDGACITSEGATCTSWTTNECGTGYYCQFVPLNVGISEEPPPIAGVCQSIEDCGLYVLEDIGIASDVGGNCAPDWWTAQSICASQNMHAISFEDLGCEESECLNSSQLYQNLLSAGWTGWESWTTSYIGESSTGLMCHYLVEDEIVSEWCWFVYDALCIK